jgi:hypothetical protein
MNSEKPLKAIVFGLSSLPLLVLIFLIMLPALVTVGVGG